MSESSLGALKSVAVTRRTVAKTAAWSVPVIALAAATPLAAASTQNVTFTVLTEPQNVGTGATFGDMVIGVVDAQGNPVSGGTLTVNVNGTGQVMPGTTFPIVDGKVTIPAGTITRTAGDDITDDVIVTGTYTPADGSAAQQVALVTILNREVIKLYHDQDSLATTGVDWTLETRPNLTTTAFRDFYIRPRIEAGTRRSEVHPILATPVVNFSPSLDVRVTATNGRWGGSSGGPDKHGLVDKHNGEHRLNRLFQVSTSGAVVVTGYADYPTGIRGEIRRAHIRMTWPTPGANSKQIEQWETVTVPPAAA